ncbi:hypothetical protein Ancab_000373 [Ancistrocladus abbreviatus]
MGTDLLLPLAPFNFSPSPQLINPNKTLAAISQNFKLASRFCCSATKSGSNGRNQRDSNAETVRTERFKFSDKYDFADEGGYTIGYGSREKRRNWWSDDAFDSEEDEDEGEEEFWLWEDSGGIDWIFKVFRSFGWMLPAIIISMLLGTGPNTMIMALVLPLGQSVLSLAIDKLRGSPGYSPKPRSRTRKKHFGRTAIKTKPSERTQEGSMGTGPARGSYQSWVAANAGSSEKGCRSGLNFGGWDELDKQAVGNTSGFSRRVETEMADGLPRGRRNNKLSRRRNREKPLFLRLLIAVFPFLGSWMRMFL